MNHKGIAVEGRSRDSADPLPLGKAQHSTLRRRG